MVAPRTSGFTIIELMIGLAIAALLVVLALPSYQVWIADGQIRNGAESIANGLRFAQAQALARNATFEFTLDPTTGTGGWTVQQIDRVTCAAVGTPAQVATFQEGASLAAFLALQAGATTVQFTSLGAFAAPCDGSPILQEVRISSAAGVAGARDLRVLVGGGVSGVAGQASRAGIKICDPQWTLINPNDPKACPS
jgi:type IV fimbrial biogenesis protein FimT